MMRQTPEFMQAPNNLQLVNYRSEDENNLFTVSAPWPTAMLTPRGRKKGRGKGRGVVYSGETSNHDQGRGYRQSSGSNSTNAPVEFDTYGVQSGDGMNALPNSRISTNMTPLKRGRPKGSTTKRETMDYEGQVMSPVRRRGTGSLSRNSSYFRALK